MQARQVIRQAAELVPEKVEHFQTVGQVKNRSGERLKLFGQVQTGCPGEFATFKLCQRMHGYSRIRSEPEIGSMR